MTKLLIVDDEPYIRHGLRHTIHWEEHGIEIVGEATNGEEALKTAIATLPDIIITDIQMPVMNGIELAEKVNELLPEIRVIILTAYDSNENLVQAIDKRVSSFVTKSADSSKILSAVLKVRDELEASRRQMESYRELSTIYHENQYLIQSNLFLSLFTGEISADAFTSKLARMGVTLSGGDYSILLARSISERDFSTINALQRAFGDFTNFIFFTEPDCVACIVCGMSREEDLNSRLIPLWPYVFSSFIAVMRGISGFGQFRESYLTLSSALDACFWNAPECCTELAPGEHVPEGDPGAVYTAESDAVSAILSKQTDRIASGIERYFSEMEALRIPHALLLDSISRLVILQNAIAAQTIELEKIMDGLKTAEQPQELKEMLLNVVLPQTRNGTDSVSFAAVYEFLDQNYMQDLKLSDLAKAIYSSPGYLSRIFKKETGYSFREYLNRLRIEKSKALILEGKLKYYEIAQKVGYKDYKYFSAYFSKYCSQSPSQFRGTAK